MAMNRPCDDGKGFYEAKICAKTIDSTKIFILSKYSIEDRGECWPELPYSKGKFNTCQAYYNDVAYYEAFYQSSSGQCVSVVDASVVANPNIANIEETPVMSTSSNQASSISSSSIGAGASLAVAPAAVLGLLFFKRKGKKNVAEDKQDLTGRDSNL